MFRGMVPASFRSRALLVFCLGAALLATFPVFGRGADGGEVVVTDKSFECSSYKQPVNFDLVKVTVTSQAGPRIDAIHTGPRCTGRIGRIEVETWNADGVKIHPGTHDLVIEGGYVRCHDRVGAVHQDGIQVMGGQRVTLKNVTVDCTTASNGALFIAQGAGGREVPTDIVCDGCTLMKGPTRNRVLRIATSVRSGARNSTIVWCGHAPSCGRGEAVWMTKSASQPVDENNRYVLHSEYGTITPKPPQPPRPPTGRALVLRSFGLSSWSPKAGTRLVAQLGVSPRSAPNAVATCRGTVAGKALKVAEHSGRRGRANCVFIVPRNTEDGLLTGLIGMTGDGSTANRSFTIPIAGESRRAGRGGRVVRQIPPASAGVSLRRFVISNQRPSAGSRVFATLTLAGVDPAADSSLKCSGVVAGESLRVLGSAFKGPNASCGWRLPAVEGKSALVSMSLVTADGATFTHSFHLKLRT